ncbi:hypothetical protein, partial [Hafnia paralvei]|uniref:hypothetical protein n=1 Tax=Hafnia paralvei TaxID=546367 RepID=UPI0020327364
MSLLNETCSSDIFRAKSGGFAEHLFDAITQGISTKLDFYRKNRNRRTKNAKAFHDKCENLLLPDAP